MSRTWCPALAAQPGALTLMADGEHSGAHSPQRPASPRDKGAVAALASVDSARAGASIAAAVAVSYAFSAHIAVSAASVGAGARAATEFAALAAHLPPLAESNAEGTQDDAVAAATVAAVPAAVAYNSLRHVTAAAAGGALGSAVVVDDVSLPTHRLGELLASDAFRGVSRLSARRSLHATRGVTAIATHAAAPGGDHLHALDLSRNPHGFGADEPTPEALTALSNYVTQTRALRSLRLAGCALGPGAVAALAPALASSGTVTELDLADNAFGRGGEEAAAALAALVRDNKFLLRLDLAHNDLNEAATVLIANALATSDTRVATPEPEPEPEPEEYTDDLGPEEEPPTVQIGLPREEDDAVDGGGTTGAEEEQEAEGEGDGAPEADQAEQQEEVEEGEEEPHEKGNRDEHAEAAAHEEQEEEEDAEATAAAAAAAEEEWRARMLQYVWEPERVHAEYAEAVARRAVMQRHFDETSALKGAEIAARRAAKEGQLARERAERERRSGWSHLQALSLAGNPIGRAGAVAVAAMLRASVPMSEEEREAAAEREAARLRAEKAKEREAARAAAAAAAAAAVAAAPPPEASSGAEAENDDAAEDGASNDAPQPQSINGDAAPGGDAEVEHEEAEDDDPAAIGVDLAQLVAEAPKKRPGVRTLHTLDLSECGIAPRGLAAIAATLRDDGAALVALLLRRNKFGVKRSPLPPRSNDENDGVEDEGAARRPAAFLAGWVSPGVEALARALRTNTVLRVLDLSHNNMFPGTIRALAAGLRGNNALTFLDLTGNKIGALLQPCPQSAGGIQKDAEEEEGSSTALEALLRALGHERSSLVTLLLGENEIGGGLDEASCVALARCRSVRRLSLSGNALDNTDLRLLAGSYFAECGDAIPLRALDLGANDLRGKSGGEAIGEIVRRCAGLQALVLRENVALGDAGFTAFAFWLVNHAALTLLDCHRTGLTTLGPLTTALPSISFLATLDFGDNNIAEHSARSFCDACRQSPGLATLRLWSRRVDLATALAEQLLDVARACPALTTVDLGVPLVCDRPPAEAAAAGAGDGDDGGDLPDALELLEAALLRNRRQRAGLGPI